MTKRRGASLVNVMVFMMFAVMVTAQVFFFTKSSSDSLAEGREIMLYRLHLQSLVEDAKDRLMMKDNTISHDNNLHFVSGDISRYDTQLKYNEFYENTNRLPPDTGNYHVSIHDLDYNFNGSSFTTGDTGDRGTWTKKDDGYGNTNAHKKLFAAMPALSKDEETTTGEGAEAVTTHNYKITNRFYLIRAWTQLPENYYGAKLMYQVLVSRDELEPSTRETYHNIETLSFQEVWY